MILALAPLAVGLTAVELGLLIGSVLVLVAISMFISNNLLARRLRACNERLAPLGFTHLPRESTCGKKPAFLALLPRQAVVRLHFRRRQSKRADEHYAEMVESTGDDDSIHYSILAQRHDGLSFPVFYLRRETVADALAASMGLNDIDLPGQHLFSTTFHLSGTDKRAIRNLFRGKLAASLARNRNWWISGGGEWLVLHRLRLHHPYDLGDFVRSARNVALAFVPASRR